ncbi:MAG: sigma-70 family RNA polymerase sigma factor [Pseudomonadales bacterium]
MAQIRQHDEAAFAELVRRHLDPLHRYLFRLTGSADDAEDLAQETFLRVWQRAASYRPGVVRLTTWLHRIAHNMAVDSLRRTRPEPLADDDDMAGLADDGADPARAASSAEFERHLDHAIGILPANQRAALLLCQVQGFANRDAAAIMGVSVRGLESLLARARRSLRLAMAARVPMSALERS